MTVVRPRRSTLFLPASNPRAIAKAATLPCDVVILDLEDAVAPDAKPAARDAAAGAVRDGDLGEREAVIRLNAPGTEWAEADLAMVAAARPAAVLLPKVSDVATLAKARAAIGPGIALWAMIETCRGVLDCDTIARRGREHGLTMLVAGTNDLALDMRCRPGIDRAPLLPALTQLVLAARAAGVGVLDGVCNTLDDESAVEAECRQGRDLGFDGKALIHPAQIAPANRVFTPDATEVSAAAAIVAAFDAPDHAGLGAIRVAGRMVERLHLAEAERTLALAAACR